ncbi:hypothetical protein D9758_018696 [Tetrapyrgos nigripes]|uniref:galacturonan 1,4-alpha-galacturonidase n=1 Tax=Tetrapyrgos nigripes TaxID=182062 RepID=A0A8H5FDN7_9AGAR|nr:hypothetical protein D9758_018696 [Tetrapyrgos nigripes]
MASQTLGILVLSLLSTASAWTTFTVPHTPGADDTPGLSSAFNNATYSITSNATILFQKGITYNIFTPIVFPTLNNVEIRIEGNLTYPSDIPTIQAIVGSSVSGKLTKESSHLQAFRRVFRVPGGNNVTLRGSTDPVSGWVDGHGQAWWDANQQTNRPHGWAFSKIKNGVIRDMKLFKPIAWNFATSGSSDLHAFNNQILAISDSDVSSDYLVVSQISKSMSAAPGVPFQYRWFVNYHQVTHVGLQLTLSAHFKGFSAGGANMLFENNHIVNGDDCITVGSGAKNIHFRNSVCENGHGLSVGSLGKGGMSLMFRTFSSIPLVYSFMPTQKNSLYGARFKSWTGGNGLARNITWRNIEFTKVVFPIYVTQNYWDQGVGPKPNTTSLNNTHIEDFVFENFSGTINDTPGYVEGSCVTDPCWYFVPGATGKEVIIFDLYPNTTANILAKDISSRTVTGALVEVMCNSKTVSNDVGFECTDGPFVPTAAGL